MVLFPDHPDLAIFKHIAVFLFVIGLIDIFYLIIKSQIFNKNIRVKDNSWQAYWILSIVIWIAMWGIYIVDQAYNIDLIR